MRHPFLIPTMLACGLVLTACAKETEEEKVERTFQEVNVIDETNLNDVMLNAADPNEAVTYFQGAAAKNPDRIDLQRGLAITLTRAKRSTEAVAAWKRVVDHEDATDDDRVDFADALIRNNEWDRADAPGIAVGVVRDSGAFCRCWYS